LTDRHPRDPIPLPFNKDGMSARDLKTAANTLQGILQMYDAFKDEPEEFTLRVAQVRDAWNPFA
jgi:hypothetical protein